MIILGIETSCDETSLAVFDTEKGVLSSFTNSQVDLHNKFGGVVPEVASRNHILKVEELFSKCMEQAELTPQDLDMIAVTTAPGLIGALFVGVSFGKALGYALKIPVMPVNHLSAHILAAELENPELKPPYTALIISGGHTHIYDVDAAYNFELLAKTVDDAAGESFDKVAKMMELGYPGGPLIEKLAEGGNEKAVAFPIAMRKENNFSFSGLKTAAMNKINDNTISREDIAASFQRTVADTLILKTLRIAKETGRKNVVVAGGVACNGYIRKAFSEQKGYSVYFPSKKLCTDNGDMIAFAAHRFFKLRKFSSLIETAHDRMQHINK
ncbi:tRNA (adenosine(37)-N6)-threonylcarbamoyltransferase complex transferase subunit TsaD [Seleniivibrio woodruffii]|uniref:tRNA N6-adenosine threonylcarbamoyltransferase n=1 Tax=Seleniivibrio woodruffii TaxID=1078050 RepID=A0A4R1K9H8_9BACT|nr:tRNA (adenosine(37)-N6)-threonylcarbamoyltransferase complex transferase subunit TsaD [Seleniivibrio woodruffii]TCK61058.1 N6-L-threonylcarbamoyladenine synthase [Seleniivibrio woodruffii]TVZ36686.1 N6-L-threonylcarbamoyladenine synthase [Seleniivibrio woodruffii]